MWLYVFGMINFVTNITITVIWIQVTAIVFQMSANAAGMFTKTNKKKL